MFPAPFCFDVHPALPAASQPDGYYSPRQIAAMFTLPLPVTRKRLERWRQAIGDDGWMENADRRNGEAQFLYLLSAVRRVVGGLIHDYAPLPAAA
jgi:hypothetical protein